MNGRSRDTLVRPFSIRIIVSDINQHVRRASLGLEPSHAEGGRRRTNLALQCTQNLEISIICQCRYPYVLWCVPLFVETTLLLCLVTRGALGDGGSSNAGRMAFEVAQLV